MAKIEKFLPILMKVEGGYANVAGDKGGKTKWGVTEMTFKSYYPKTSQTILSMTYEQMEHIYKVGYWDRCKADDIKNQSVANLLVDFAVNSGVTRATKYIQSILGLTQDGYIGPVSLKAINTANQRNLFDRLKEKRKAYYEAVVRADVSQSKFLKGWLNRLTFYSYED